MLSQPEDFQFIRLQLSNMVRMLVVGAGGLENALSAVSASASTHNQLYFRQLNYCFLNQNRPL